MAAVTLLQKWQLLQAILADQEISPSAKLVAARLLYHHSAQTGRCSPSYQTLAEGAGLTRRSVMTGVRELEERGWLSVERVKGGDPSAARGFVTNAFAIAFGRLAAVHPVEEGVKETTLPPGEENDTPPSAENFTPPSAVSFTHGVKKTALGGVKETTLNSGKVTEKGNREESPPTPSDFDRLWEAYPLKVGRDDARLIFLRTIHSHKGTADEIIAGAQRYAQAVADKDPKYIKQPVNWLRGRHWLDELPRPRDPGVNLHPLEQIHHPQSATAILKERRARRLGHG